MLKVSSRWINHKIKRGVVNSYNSVENGTLLCDKASLSQSSNNWLSKFMHGYNFINKKHINKNYK